MPSSLHVLVIGGGIGGLCLAQGLKAAGVSVAVYERNSAHVWPEGTRISINPVGSRALHDCLPPVLWDAFVAAAGRIPAGVGFLTEQLEELVVIAEAFMSQDATRPIDAHYPIPRIALRHILLAGLEDIVCFDKVFERYEQAPGGKVTAFFADGASATGDVLIGADGANSRVRQHYLPQAPRVEAGAGGIGNRLPLTDETRAWLPSSLVTRMNLIMSLDRYTLFTAFFDHPQQSAETLNTIRASAEAAGLDPEPLIDDSQSYILWALLSSTSSFSGEMYSLHGQALLPLVQQIMAGWHPALKRLVAESDPTGLAIQTFKASTLINSWESSNVTLLGDSIHNMPPVGGLGGNMALRDAASLTRLLTAVEHEKMPLLTAIQIYEEEMRKYSFAAVRSALRNTHRATTSNRLERLTARTWFQLCRTLPPLRHTLENTWTQGMHQEQR